MTKEDLSEAKSLIGQIEKIDSAIEYWQHPDAMVKLWIDANCRQTIGCFSGCEHELTPYAIEFVGAVVVHYETRRAKLSEKLTRLFQNKAE